jgi:hypothetical protein
MSDRSRNSSVRSTGSRHWSIGETVTATAYIDPGADPLRPLTAADIERAFRKPAGWFGRDRVRKRLYAQGFPHPFERGLWSAKAVADWLATAGSNPTGAVPRPMQKASERQAELRPRPTRRQRSNGYAPVVMRSY